MNDLPEEVLKLIFSMLSGRDRAAICTVSLTWYKHILAVSFGCIPEIIMPPTKDNMRYICENTHRFIRYWEYFDAYSDTNSYDVCKYASVGVDPAYTTTEISDMINLIGYDIFGDECEKTVILSSFYGACRSGNTYLAIKLRELVMK